jgi:hypothetical protein
MTDARKAIEEFELDHKDRFLVDTICYKCGRQDHLMNYSPGDVAILPLSPRPTARCICGAEFLLKFAPADEGCLAPGQCGITTAECENCL